MKHQFRSDFPELRVKDNCDMHFISWHVHFFRRLVYQYDFFTIIFRPVIWRSHSSQLALQTLMFNVEFIILLLISYFPIEVVNNEVLLNFLCNV